MSSITRIKLLTHCNDLGGKVWNPALRWTKKFAVFVEVEDSDGLTGMGECWCFDSQPDGLVAFLRTEVIPYFLGSDLDDLEGRCAERVAFATLSARHGVLASALSGLDIAAWDIRAQRQKRPMWQAINSAGPGKTQLYASGGLYGEGKMPSDLADEMVGLAAHFSIVKMKVGALSLDEDLIRVNAVLDQLPQQTKLIIDCVYRYDYDQFQRLFQSLPRERIEAIQSPLPARAYKDMARLVRNDVPVMANEAEYRHELHDELIERRAVKFLQVSPVACGGISRLVELATSTTGTPVDLSLEVSSTALALTAATQFAAASAEVAHVEHHSIHDVFFDQLALQRIDQTCWFAPPNALGLGFATPDTSLSLVFDSNA